MGNNLIMGFPTTTTKKKKKKKRFGNLYFMSCNGMTKVLIMGFPTKKCFVNLHFTSFNIIFQSVHHGIVLLLPMHKDF